MLCCQGVSLIHLESRRTQGHKKQCQNVTNAIQIVNQNTIEYYWMGWKCLVVPWKQEMHLRASGFATCATRKQEIDGIQTSRKSFWHLERPPRWRRVRHHRLQRRCHLAEWQKGHPWCAVQRSMPDKIRTTATTSVPAAWYSNSQTLRLELIVLMPHGTKLRTSWSFHARLHSVLCKWHVNYVWHGTSQKTNFSLSCGTARPAARSTTKIHWWQYSAIVQ